MAIWIVSGVAAFYALIIIWLGFELWRAAPPQTPVAVASSAMPSMIKQDNASLPKPQPPPPELMQYP
jgi:hypothetical protein